MEGTAAESNVLVGVTCCDLTSMSEGLKCRRGVSHDTAEEHCKEAGRWLCTQADFKAVDAGRLSMNVNASCDMTGLMVWTNDSCEDSTVGPLPALGPPEIVTSNGAHDGSLVAGHFLNVSLAKAVGEIAAGGNPPLSEQASNEVAAHLAVTAAGKQECIADGEAGAMLAAMCCFPEEAGILMPVHGPDGCSTGSDFASV